MVNSPSIFSKMLRYSRWVVPKLLFFCVVAVKVIYVKMFFYVMPSSSVEGLVILYGLLFVVVMLRVPEEYRQTGLSELALWVLAITFVLGVDWFIIYLTRENISILAV